MISKFMVILMKLLMMIYLMLDNIDAKILWNYLKDVLITLYKYLWFIFNKV